MLRPDPFIRTIAMIPNLLRKERVSSRLKLRQIFFIGRIYMKKIEMHIIVKKSWF